MLAGKDCVLAGEDCVLAGEDRVLAGEDRVLAGEDRVLARNIAIAYAWMHIRYTEATHGFGSQTREPHGHKSTMLAR